MLARYENLRDMIELELELELEIYISALSTVLKIYKFWCHILYTHYFGCSNNCKIDSWGQGKKTL